MNSHKFMLKRDGDLREVLPLLKGEANRYLKISMKPILNYWEDILSNVIEWRNAGYTGKGVEVATLDQHVDVNWPGWRGRVNQPLSFSHDANEFDEFGPHNEYTPPQDPRDSHGHSVISRLLEIAPDVKVYNLPYRLDRRTSENYFIYGRVPDSLRWCLNNGVRLVNGSLVGATDERILREERKIWETGVTLVTSAGNRGDEGGDNTLTAWARTEHWISVGALRFDLTSKYGGVIDRWERSSYGDELEVMQFGRVIGRRWGNPFGGLYPYGVGTSLASPRAVGMVAIWYQWHYEHYRRYPTQQETREFMRNNTVYITDQGQTSWNKYFGYGMFRLPSLKDL